MAPSPFSLLLRHRTRHRLRHFHRLFLSPIKHFSSSSSDPSKPTSSLSARLSFVFDKIDEIEKDRSEKDDALQRIRAWRQAKRPNHDEVPAVENRKLGLGFSADDDLRYSGEELVVEEEKGGKEGVGLMKREIELAHPWPEWIELMERLVYQNYFDHRRKDEDKMLEGLGGSFELSRVAEEEGFDFTRDWKTVQTAILNFGRDRFDIFRSLSRHDIQILVGYGCPSVDKKLVFSAKLLRKYAHLDEGDVCSSCSLRSSCERAYLITNKEDEARTLDMMRVLLTYGFDHITGSVQNKSLLTQKSVKHVVRKLLHEVVRLSAVPIDPNLPPPVIKPRPPKVKQPPPPPRKRVGRDDIEMKKGDWLCPKCNFMNFAKNVVCLQCDAKRPKRELLPGEWECPECNFLNYRRNMACFSCELKRPPDEYTDTQVQERQHRPITRLEKMANRPEVSNAWNFDFDDDESDGADVAAFEYADPNAMHEDSRLDNEPQHTNFGRVNDDLYRVSKASRSQEHEYSRPAPMKPGKGFDDFEDEDDDDVDSYEVDRNPKQESSSVRFSDVEAYSESEGDVDLPRYSRASSKPLSNLGHNDLDFDSDEDLPVHPGWKSSHVANSGNRDRARDSRGPSKQRSFRSNQDDRLVFGSDDDDDDDDDDLDDKRGFTPRRGRGSSSRLSGQRGGFSRADGDSNRGRRQTGFRGRDDFKSGGYSRGDSDDDNDLDEKRGFTPRRGRGSSSRLSGQRGGFSRADDDSNRGRRQTGFRGRDDFESRESLGQNRRQNGFKGRNEFDFVKRSDFADEFGRSSRGHGKKESFGDDRRETRMSGRGRGGQRGSRNGGVERRFNKTDNWTDVDSDIPRSHRVNVR